MKFTMIHNCIKVRELERSLAFYRDMLHLVEKGRVNLGQVTLVYLGDEAGSTYELELNYQAGHSERDYELGENSTHFAFMTDDYEAALARHRATGCVVFESQENHFYFIKDPDGYIIEVMPREHFSRTERE